MDIVKKNLLSIICGVVALVCVVLIFFPFGGMYSELSSEVTKRASLISEINTVNKQERFWPSISDKPEDKIPLKAFPTRATIEKAKKVTDDWTNQATRFRSLAFDLQARQLKLLVPGSLPVNTSTTTGFTFIEEYQKRFGVWTNPRSGEKPQEKSIYTQILQAGQPPVDTEVKEEQTRVAERIRSTSTVVVNGQVQNEAQVQQLVLEEQTKVLDNMRAERAYKSMIYADPATSLEVNQKIAGNSAPLADDIFVAQVSLWVQEEICRAIAEANGTPKWGVLETPIKRLVRLQLAPRYNPAVSVAGQPAPTDVPVAPVNLDARITPNFATNPLGQESNDYYDVLRFELTLMCDAESLPKTIGDLSKNRYIMFRDVKVIAVDSAAEAAMGFLYGKGRVVEVRISGQYLMLRQFIAPLMPPNVIRGLAAPAAGVAPEPM